MNTLSRPNGGIPEKPPSQLRTSACRALVVAAVLLSSLATGSAQDDPQTSSSQDAPRTSPAAETQDSITPSPPGGAELETPNLAPAEPVPPPDQQPVPGSTAIDLSGPLPSEEEFVPPEEVPLTPAAIRADYQDKEMTQTLQQRTTLLDGVGGLGSPLSSPIGRPVSGRGKGFKLGPIQLNIDVGAGVLGGKDQDGSSNSSSGSNNDVGVSAFGSINFIAILEQPAYDRSATISYGVTGSVGSYNQTNGPINQALSIQATQKFTKAQLDFAFVFAGLSGVSRDVGTDRDRNFLIATLGLTYELGAKTSLSSSLSAPIRQVDDGLGSGGVTVSNFINYAVSPKLSVGPGVSLGFEKVQDGGMQTFESPLIGVNYKPSPFIGLSGNAGYEFRQIDGVTYTSPVFGIGVTWTPRIGSVVSFNASRSIQTSATSVNTNYNETTIGINARQSIGKRIGLNAGFSYQNAVYQSVGSSGQTGRVDNLVEGEIGISYSINAQWAATLSFSAGKNFSNENPIDYQQLIFQTSYSF